MPKGFSSRTNSFKTFLKQSTSPRVSKIYESRNIMQIIMEIKRQEDFENKKTTQTGPHKSKFQTNTNEITLRENRDEEYEFDFKKYKSILIKQTRRARKEVSIVSEANIEIFEDQEELVPLLLEKFFRKLIVKAQTLKKEFKISKGLNVNDDFVLVNVHVCQYCGQKFAKPCSLGGHISKLHPDEKKKKGSSEKTGNTFQLQAIKKNEPNAQGCIQE